MTVNEFCKAHNVSRKDVVDAALALKVTRVVRDNFPKEASRADIRGHQGYGDVFARLRAEVINAAARTMAVLDQVENSKQAEMVVALLMNSPERGEFARGIEGALEVRQIAVHQDFQKTSILEEVTRAFNFQS